MPDRPDPALGVFETLLVSEGRIHGLAGHLERMDRSLRQLYGLVRPVSLPAELQASAARLRAPHRLRADAIPAQRRLEIELTVSALAPGPPTSVVARPVPMPGGLGEHKWRDRRWIETVTTSADLPLVMDHDGSLLEAAWANLWLREGNCLITPPADGRLLPGTTRAQLIKLAPALGFTVAEEPVSLARAAEAAEVFLTSSLRLAVPAMITGLSEAGSVAVPLALDSELARIREALRRAW